MCPYVNNLIISFSISNNTLFMLIKNSFNSFVGFINESFFLFLNNHIDIAFRQTTSICIFETKIIKNSFNSFIDFINESFFFFRNNHIDIAYRQTTSSCISETKIFKIVKEFGSNFIPKFHKHLPDETTKGFLNQ